jgi:hypothetical protein
MRPRRHLWTLLATVCFSAFHMLTWIRQRNPLSVLRAKAEGCHQSRRTKQSSSAGPKTVKSINFSRLVSKLPNLKSIYAGVSFSSSGLINILKAAQLARKLTSLELRGVLKSPLCSQSLDTDEEKRKKNRTRHLFWDY